MTVSCQTARCEFHLSRGLYVVHTYVQGEKATDSVTLKLRTDARITLDIAAPTRTENRAAMWKRQAAGKDTFFLSLFIIGGKKVMFFSGRIPKATF